MREEPYVPEWACSQWGSYEHDWMDCFECVQSFECYLEENYERDHVQASSTDPIDSLYTDYETIGG